MECKLRFILERHHFAISILFLLLGSIILSYSHALYVGEKVAYYATHPSTPFEESMSVKTLDVLGLVFMSLPFINVVMVVFLKFFKNPRKRDNRTSIQLPKTGRRQ